MMRHAETRTMLAIATRSRQRTAATAASRAACASLTREVRPVVGADPLRGRAGRRGGAGLKRKLPGRGVWVTATRAALAEAIKRKALWPAASSARSRLPPICVDRTERLLERAALDALAMAGKAGQVVAGFAKVEDGLGRQARSSALIHAAEAARRRGPQAGRRAAAPSRRSRGRIPVDREPSRRRNWIWHWAAQMWYMQPCSPGPASETFLARCRRLERFRTGDHGTECQVRGQELRRDDDAWHAQTYGTRTAND